MKVPTELRPFLNEVAELLAADYIKYKDQALNKEIIDLLQDIDTGISFVVFLLLCIFLAILWKR